MEPGTGLAVLGTALGSAKIAEKILGPTADYIGDGLRTWTAKRVDNVARIFENARRHLGKKLDEPGVVPPRVLKEILDEGAYCEDELGCEYFGGVLASSRSGVSRDDRGASFASAVTRMSTYQIRSHFLIYSLFKELFDCRSHAVTTDVGRRELEMFVSFEAFTSGLEITSEENFEVILSHSIVGLVAENLLDGAYKYGRLEFLKTNGYAEAPTGGILISPSMFGIELYHWAHGMGNLPPASFLSASTTFSSTVTLNISGIVRSTRFPEVVLGPSGGANPV